MEILLLSWLLLSSVGPDTISGTIKTLALYRHANDLRLRFLGQWLYIGISLLHTLKR